VLAVALVAGWIVMPDQMKVLFLQLAEVTADDLELVFRRAFEGVLDPAASR
jgi:hypothetical protein